MADYVLVQVEGVLAQMTSERFIESQPDTHGRLTYFSLLSNYKALLWCDEELDPELVQHWLRVNGIGRYVKVLQGQPKDVIRAARVAGNVAFGLVANPEYARALLGEGCTALLYTNPRYARREWRPDFEHGTKKWEQVIEELNEQSAMHEADQRLTADLGRYE